MKDVVTSVKVMDADGHIYDMSSDELDFSYRHSAVEAEGLIVLEVTMKLAAGVQQDIDDRMKELSDSRRTSSRLSIRRRALHSRDLRDILRVNL